jgi:cytoskeletal protein CcmA (bactofilin family)
MFSRNKPPVPGRIDTLVARSTSLQGDLEFAGGLHLDGRVVGRVRAAPTAEASTLWIGEPGSVEGSVEARHVVVHGSVKGDVCGHDRVVLGATARITGDVHYGAIEMTLGARIDGRLVPQAAADRVAAVPPAATAPAAAAPTAPELELQPFDAAAPRN